MRKVSMKFPPTTGKVLTKWLIGESDPLNKKELSEKTGTVRQTLYIYIKKLRAGEKTIEELLTVDEMLRLIAYQNEVIQRPKKEDVQRQKNIEQQLTFINSIRKSQKQPPLTLDEFIEKNL